jgi:SAM-dependent methyltransferase
VARGDRGHPLFALGYSLFARFAEKVLGPHRREIVSQASGRVVEIGAGTGLNFKYYPAAVTQIVATEPEPHMLKRAKKAAAAAGSRFSVEQRGAESLGVEEASVDNVVSTLVLCSVPNPADALAEIKRVLKPGGSLLFFEHVRASDPGLAAKQDKRERMWGMISAGCHPNRDTESAIRAAGFDIEGLQHFDVKGSKLVRPHILGVARKPAAT